MRLTEREPVHQVHSWPVRLPEEADRYVFTDTSYPEVVAYVAGLFSTAEIARMDKAYLEQCFTDYWYTKQNFSRLTVKSLFF